ncbi:MAG: thiamine pyrophosphate-binding protein [Magnetococcales bacterium]|nr:thiamine pyrophosphate-binding protein [Magnetococcales bacterium]
MSSQPLSGEIHSPATLADMVLTYLEQIGVDTIFGVPGGAIEPLFNALARFARQNRKPRVVVARHESGAAFMADGYTRETGRLGVCCATSGPGTTNLITGVASAYEDRIPMLVITAQPAAAKFGRNALQESTCPTVNILSVFEGCTRYNAMVSHPEQLERKLLTAITTALRHPQGPVHLSIPMDVFGHSLDGVTHLSCSLSDMLQEPETVDHKSIDKLCEKIALARKVVLYLDKGAAPAIEQILAFAELTKTPIVTTPAGKFLLSAYHPLYHGVFGFAGHASAHQIVLDKEMDLILAVGSNFGEMSTGGWDEALLTKNIVHIDANMENFSHSPMAKLRLHGFLPATFSELVKRATKIMRGGALFPGKASATLKNRNNANKNIVSLHHPTNILMEDKQSHVMDGSSIKPQQLIYQLAHLFPENTRFLADAGNSWAWMTHYLHLRNHNNYRIAFGYGAMAWGIGAAIGTAMGNRYAPVVCVTGDGSFLMSGQELTVAVSERLAVIFVILNDSSLGMVKHGQRLGGGEAIGYELPEIDFTLIAKAMGAEGFVIRSLQDFRELDIERMCRRMGPTVLDVRIDPEAVPPIGNRLKGLGRLNESRTVIHNQKVERQNRVNP